MTTQFDRAIALDVGDGFAGFAIKSTSNLRVTFEVERDEKSWPNTAVIKVYNLNPDHRGALAALQGVPCRLQAGYRDGMGTVFDGMLRDAISTHEPPDWVTALQAGDGELDKNGETIAGKSVRKTWSKGTPIFQILIDFAAALNVDLGNVPTMGAAARLSTGPALLVSFGVDGPALDEFIYFMRSARMPWSIQGGKLQVRPAPEIPASVGPLIAKETGMIGMIETSTEKVKRFNKTKTIKVCKGKTLLNANLIPGQMCLLKSSNVTGNIQLTKVKQVGDTGGQEWYSEFEAIYGV
jgi:hypothetical protein